jgi:hypothetical protein
MACRANSGFPARLGLRQRATVAAMFFGATAAIFHQNTIPANEVRVGQKVHYAPIGVEVVRLRR